MSRADDVAALDPVQAVQAAADVLMATAGSSDHAEAVQLVRSLWDGLADPATRLDALERAQAVVAAALRMGLSVPRSSRTLH